MKIKRDWKALVKMKRKKNWSKLILSENLRGFSDLSQRHQLQLLKTLMPVGNAASLTSLRFPIYPYQAARFLFIAGTDEGGPSSSRSAIRLDPRWPF